MTEKMETIYMRKKGSPMLVKIYQDHEDGHFCVAELVKLKDQTIRCRHYFLRADLNQFIEMYRRDGFCPVEDPGLTPKIEDVAAPTLPEKPVHS